LCHDRGVEDTARTLRERLAMYRRLLAAGADVHVADAYLKAIAETETRLDEIEARQGAGKEVDTKPRSNGRS